MFWWTLILSQRYYRNQQLYDTEKSVIVDLKSDNQVHRSFYTFFVHFISLVDSLQNGIGFLPRFSPFLFWSMVQSTNRLMVVHVIRLNLLSSPNFNWSLHPAMFCEMTITIKIVTLNEKMYFDFFLEWFCHEICIEWLHEHSFYTCSSDHGTL